MSKVEQMQEAAIVKMMSRADVETVNQLCTQLKSAPGPLMPILHAVQERLGFIPHDAVPLIAHALNLSIAEVHGVVSFYHYFRKDRGGRHVVHVCRAEACQSVGAAALEAHAKRTLGIDFHGRTPDGALSLEPVYCLGNCALGPSIMIDQRLHGRVSPQCFDELMAKARATTGALR
jgi:formate dehydrogenase subunit gamma